MQELEKNVELELSPHTISHKTGTSTNIAARSLKVVTKEVDSTAVLDDLIDKNVKENKKWNSLDSKGFMCV